jgi:hypothetical protein
VSGATVQVLDAGGGVLGSATTGVNGAYTLVAATATSAVSVRAQATGYLQPADILVALPAGGTLADVNFALARQGVAGRVTDASHAGLGGVTIQVYSAAGAAVTSATTSSVVGSLGTYMTTQLPPGTYYVRAGGGTGGTGRVVEHFDNVTCVGCSPATGDGVVVLAGQASTGIDFELEHTGGISGSVTDAAGLAGVAGARVDFLTPSGAMVSSSNTVAAGTYTSPALPAGSYLVRAQGPSGTSYMTEVFSGLTCAPCTVTDGMPVTVASGATTTGVNLALQRGGQISGTIRDGITNDPVGSIVVDIFDSTGASVGVTSPSLATTGAYTSGGLPAGTYYARARVSPGAPEGSRGYIRTLYNGVPCSGCSPLAGTPIVVAANVVTGNTNFLLARGGTIAGHIKDAVTNLPIQGVTVQLFNSGGLVAGFATTGVDGNYLPVEGLGDGTYYARTTNGRGYLNQVYAAFACQAANCTPTSGTPIPVVGGAAVTGKDFALSPGGRVAGRMRDSATGATLAGVTASVLDSTGQVIGAGVSDLSGAYLSGGVPPGAYRVRTQNRIGRVNEVHPDVQCLGCNPALVGSAISVLPGSTVSGIDFALDAGSRVTGMVTSGGGNLPGIEVGVWATGAPFAAATGIVRETGTYTTDAGLPAGTYTARTQNSLGYVNERWDDKPCLTECAAGAGDPIELAAPAVKSGIDFVLELDVDSDGDGILSSVDTAPTVSSADFSDVPQGGTTTGTIAQRSGWTLAIADLSPGGVRAASGGSGFEPAVLHVCPSGAHEEIWLDADGAVASVVCSDTGSTSAKATSNRPVQMRKTIGGLTTVVNLTPGQGATMGSPVVADPANLEPLAIALRNPAGQDVGAFALDPGESAEAVVSEGVITVNVFSGTVDVTVGGETETLGVGESREFGTVCQPLSIVGVTASPEVLWPANHRMVNVTLSPAFEGTCGTVTSRVISVTSSEPVVGVGAGSTAPDWEIGTGLTVKLRAERSGTGPGRTYTVSVESTDESGNVATGTAVVTVPHDR